MKKLKFSAIFLLLLGTSLSFSCKDSQQEPKKEEAVSQSSSSEEMKEEMTKTSKTKFNPAHGVEGHRCDIPVGAPLEQAKASAQTEMTSSPVRLKSATPAINPPHGEPGHDCSVPVGGKLN